MTNRYFGTARREILPWLPQTCERVLEVGCGTGATLAAIRETKPVSYALGVEPDESSANLAKANFDHVITSFVEDAPIEANAQAESLDLILCLDVLEHLVDPWATVKRLTPLLKTGGRMIVSLPNIRNWKFIRGLFFKGSFRYTDAGLLDRTHLRFFVRETAIELIECGGLKLVDCVDAKDYSPFEFRKILMTLTAGGMSDLLAKQYIIVADKK